ncbi:hypothetical protein PF008_g12308 [Phytophthora fragariae]|uniref:Secreted protein n=1 Tax=Phytophthora fragariae TaxID=53985 RepID=A0A6G0RNT2_9STRA|nr:hypothetical protein PF008_g12308 [Phytophthora fragariae]
MHKTWKYVLTNLCYLFINVLLESRCIGFVFVAEGHHLAQNIPPSSSESNGSVIAACLLEHTSPKNKHTNNPRLSPSLWMGLCTAATLKC